MAQRRVPLDPRMIDFCTTDRQREVLEAVLTNPRKQMDTIARDLDMNSRSLRKTLRLIRLRAADAGFAPEMGNALDYPLPAGQKLKGVTDLVNADGDLIMRYIKSKEDPTAWQELLEEALEGFTSEIPKARPITLNKTTARHLNPDLLSNYIVTDFHLGMLAWSEETRSDPWDLRIAESTWMQWFDMAVSRSGPAAEACLMQIGDFMHFDGIEAVTPISGHILDADSRFGKLVFSSIRLMRYATNLLLKNHERVRVICAEGNHDRDSSAWLRGGLHAMYENEPRVTIDTSHDPYYAFEFGENFIGCHHGHLTKPNQIDTVMAAKFREMWGRTTQAYVHMGHLHHDLLKETPLMTVEQHRTLASADAYASRNGFLSGRSAKVIDYDARYGEVNRATITPAMLRVLLDERLHEHG